jgi:large subunit ribosomal protein L22
MTKIVARLTQAKYSPRKMRVVVEKIKDLPLERARHILMVSTQKGAKMLLPVINSAIANAKNNYGIKEEELIIQEIQVGDARKVRKPSYRARGQMDWTRTRYSHLRVVLTTKTEEINKN